MDREVTTEITNAMADDGCPRDTDAEQSLAADGAIACFSSSLIPSAWMLIARRS